MNTKWIFVICSCVFLNGCLESHDDYYKAHINEAELKSHSCNLSLNNALSIKDHVKADEISENYECIAAIKVYKAYKQRIEQDHKIKEKLVAKRLEQINQKKFDNEYAAQLLLLKDLPYLNYLTIKKQCKNVPVASINIRARCKAYNDSFEAKQASEIVALQKKYKGPELEVFRDKACTGKNFDQVYCGLAMVAAKNQIKQLKEEYISNENKLKADFNQCQKTYTKLIEQGERRQAQKLLLSYQCKIVGDSARKLKVYNFKKAIL